MPLITLDDVWNKLELMDGTLKDVKDSIQTNTNTINEVLPKVNKLEKDCLKMKNELKTLKEKYIRLDCYTRRDNLIFGGIAETYPEDCQEKIRFVISNQLELNSQDYKFVKVYRIGKKQQGVTRPILASFHFFGDRQEVWQRRSKMKDSVYWMSEDFPEEIQERRKILKPILKHGIQTNYPEKIYLVGDRLIIGENSYTIDTLSRLPENLQPGVIATPKIGENLLAFFNKMSPLSNFHPGKFTLEGVEYQHVEQYFCAKKAEVAKEEKIKLEIMSTECPVRCKQLAKPLRNSHEWKRQQDGIMKTGCQAKFEQNQYLRNFLLNTGGKQLVEARADDSYWGAGVNATDPKLVAEKYPGKNKLGKILVEVREALA